MTRPPTTARQAIRQARTVTGVFALPDSHIDVPISKQTAYRLLGEYPEELDVRYWTHDRYCRVEPADLNSEGSELHIV